MVSFDILLAIIGSPDANRYFLGMPLRSPFQQDETEQKRLLPLSERERCYYEDCFAGWCLRSGTRRPPMSYTFSIILACDVEPGRHAWQQNTMLEPSQQRAIREAARWWWATLRSLTRRRSPSYRVPRHNDIAASFRFCKVYHIAASGATCDNAHRTMPPLICLSNATISRPVVWIYRRELECVIYFVCFRYAHERPSFHAYPQPFRLNTLIFLHVLSLILLFDYAAIWADKKDIFYAALFRRWVKTVWEISTREMIYMVLLFTYFMDGCLSASQGSAFLLSSARPP